MLSEPVPGWRGNNVRVDGQPNLDDIRRSVWETTLSGAGWVNQNDPSFGWNRKAAIFSKSANRNKAYDYAGYCANFLNNTINIKNFEPDKTVSSTGTALVDRDLNEYVVYSP